MKFYFLVSFLLLSHIVNCTPVYMCDGSVYCEQIYCEGFFEMHMFWKCRRTSDQCDLKINVDEECIKNGFVCNKHFYEKTVCIRARQQCVNAVNIEKRIQEAHCNKRFPQIEL